MGAIERRDNHNVMAFKHEVVVGIIVVDDP